MNVSDAPETSAISLLWASIASSTYLGSAVLLILCENSSSGWRSTLTLAILPPWTTTLTWKSPLFVLVTAPVYVPSLYATPSFAEEDVLLVVFFDSLFPSWLEYSVFFDLMV